jgi:hypothetical protein
MTATAAQAKVIGQDLRPDAEEQKWLQVVPYKGSLPTPVPTDPLIYRWYEIVSVYGTTIKELIHEEFGDGIMSAIDFSMDIAPARPQGRPCECGAVGQVPAVQGQVVRRQLQRHLVTRQDADVVLLHLAGGVRNQLVPVFERDAETRVREDFVHDAVHFNQFFLGHGLFLCVAFAASPKAAEKTVATLWAPAMSAAMMVSRPRERSGVAVRSCVVPCNPWVAVAIGHDLCDFGSGPLARNRSNNRAF